MPNSPSEELLNTTLKGAKTDKEWTVHTKLKKEPNASGGNFSIGYLANDNKGNEVFVKATDIGLLTRGTNKSAFDRTADAFSEQRFERQMLDICHGTRMDRVVYAIDYGEFELIHEGIRECVFYIIFEPAKGDVRSQSVRSFRMSLSWACVAMHNLSIAVQQLHQAKISHNDIKPSNLLVFDEDLQKLADLGRATSEQVIGPWDASPSVGDRTYASPELWYICAEIPISNGKVYFSSRQRNDLYLIGSMAYFFVTGQQLTQVILTKLKPVHDPRNWTGDYETLVPFLVDALDQAMLHFDEILLQEYDPQIIAEMEKYRTLILKLCNPDPRYRGQRSNTVESNPNTVISRCVSLFDLIAKKIAHLEKR